VVLQLQEQHLVMQAQTTVSQRGHVASAPLVDSQTLKALLCAHAYMHHMHG
jgi:hypothetical protein